jgi:hypothetical protein
MVQSLRINRWNCKYGGDRKDDRVGYVGIGVGDAVGRVTYISTLKVDVMLIGELPWCSLTR